MFPNLDRFLIALHVAHNMAIYQDTIVQRLRRDSQSDPRQRAVSQKTEAVAQPGTGHNVVTGGADLLSQPAFLPRYGHRLEQ